MSLNVCAYSMSMVELGPVYTLPSRVQAVQKPMNNMAHTPASQDMCFDYIFGFFYIQVLSVPYFL